MTQMNASTNTNQTAKRETWGWKNNVNSDIQQNHYLSLSIKHLAGDISACIIGNGTHYL